VVAATGTEVGAEVFGHSGEGSILDLSHRVIGFADRRRSSGSAPFHGLVTMVIGVAV
jgi:hypothetical protein